MDPGVPYLPLPLLVRKEPFHLRDPSAVRRPCRRSAPDCSLPPWRRWRGSGVGGNGSTEG